MLLPCSKNWQSYIKIKFNLCNKWQTNITLDIQGEKKVKMKSSILLERWAGHVARMGEGGGVYRVLVGKPEGKRPLGRPRHRWEDNIRMDLQQVGLGYEDWIGLAQDRDRWRALVSAVRNVRVP